MRLLVASAMSVFGDEESFVTAWYEHWQEVRANQLGSKESLRSFAAMTNLLAVIHAATVSEQPNPLQMTDEELADEVESARRGWLQQNPLTAREVLNSLGWTVIAPSESDLPSVTASN
jgi:hypothetical protein